MSYLRVIRLEDVWHNGKRVPLEYTEKMREKFNIEVIGMLTMFLNKSREWNITFTFRPIVNRILLKWHTIEVDIAVF